MELESLRQILLFIVLIILSAFFSGSEAAYFYLSKELVTDLKGDSTHQSKRIVNLLAKPRHLLITILVGNTLVNAAAASVAAIIATDIFKSLHISKALVVLSEVIVVTIVLLLVCELIPKIVAVKNAYKFAAEASLALTVAHYILFPVVILLDQFPTLLSGFFSARLKKNLLSKDELKTLIEFSEKRGTLEEDEKDMIHSIFELYKTTVREIMVPRIDMVCVEQGTKLTKLINLIHSKGHTRIPLYNQTIDNVLGIIHAKELLPFIKNKNKKVDLVSLARPAMFVPESKHIDTLLSELQAAKQHMAIVVDEYGGTAGLITLEDVIEEIVGEIQDEYDEEKPLINKIDELHYLVDAKMDLAERSEERRVGKECRSRWSPYH